MKVCVAGASGAFGIKHLDAIRNIDGVEVTSIVGGRTGDLEGFAKERGVKSSTGRATSTRASPAPTSTPSSCRRRRKCMQPKVLRA